MDRIQGLALVLSFVFLSLILWFTSRHRFRDRRAFLWILLGAGSVLTALCIPLLNRLARELGVAYMPALVFVLAFFVILVLLMVQASSLSKQEQKLNAVIQDLAFVQQELDDLKDPGRNNGRGEGA